MADARDSERLPEPIRDPDWMAQRRRQGLKLLWRLLAYHAVLAVAVLFGAMLWPGFLDLLPVGGVDTLAESSDVKVSTASDTRSMESDDGRITPLTDAAGGLDRLGYARRLLIVLLGVWLLMLPVSWVHKGIHLGSEHDHSLDETTLILPGVVASIVLVVQHSLALAFSLAGIVAGVQFRRALQDTFDALFILVAIGVGIASGVAALEIAAVLSVFFCYATLYVCFCGDGLEAHHLAQQKLEKKQRKAAAGKSSQEPPAAPGP